MIRCSRLAGTFRAMSARQDAVMFGLPEAQSRRELERLCAAGWLGRLATWEVVPAGRLALTGPLAVRERGGPPPDLKAVARELDARRMRARRPVVAYRATARAVNLVGGTTPDLSKPGQASHDLAIVDMYLAATADRPALAAGWFGEDEIRRVLRGGDSYPDALVVKADGSLRAFELGGTTYTVRRLEECLLGCARLGILEWEVW
jgi:hypothetical protein